uniref:KIFC3 n=1 Tax=Poeciliopsis prolifica TaxID=188132 RepID=A0A0S7ELF2_9TELE
MFGTRQSWDIVHAPCLQELWKKDLSLDASSVDFLMSDGEEDGSFLSLPAAAFSQRPPLTAELNASSSHQLLIQTLQDKVSELQACFSLEEVSCQQGGGAWTQGEEPLLATPTGVKPNLDRFSRPEEEQLVSRLHTQVATLEQKLLDRTQEVERLRSELGATDLEKQLERLLVENERLKQELKSLRSSELQPDAAADGCSRCNRCNHAQEAESLRRQAASWESRARQRELRLAELQQELQESTCRAEALQLQLDDSRRRRSEEEQKLHLRLQECEEEMARQAVAPPRVKVVTQMVQVESADSQKALVELQVKNGSLQEQLSLQRQLLRELEAQLHDSQRTCTQLRTQIHVYEGEMQRAQGQLEPTCRTWRTRRTG